MELRQCIFCWQPLSFWFTSRLRNFGLLGASINSVLPLFWYQFRGTFRIWVLRTVCGCMQFCVVQIFCELPKPHGKISQTVVRISTAIPHFIFCFGFLELIRTTRVELVRHFALELDMLTNPAMSMLTTNCFQNFLERQEVRNCPFRIQLSSPLWSTVASDRWPTNKNIS